MTSFAAKTFNASLYFAARPTYPQSFHNLTLAYHTSRGGRFDSALDLGCGPGLIASQLTSRFTTVLGVDPGEKMISVAQSASDLPEVRLQYRVGKGEDLSFVKDSSVDLITVGQAAHWFDFDIIWNELGRVLKPGGSVAFWGYGENTFPAHPSLQSVISRYQTSLPWQQPGRSIVEGLLSSLPFPIAPSQAPSPTIDLLSSRPWTLPQEPTPPAGLTSTGWDPESMVRVRETPEGGPLGIPKTMTWEQYDDYFGTASGLHEYARLHGEEAGRKLRKDFLEEVKGGVKREGGRDDGKIDVVWPAVVMLAGKKL